jgi:hypothetical protein
MYGSRCAGVLPSWVCAQERDRQSGGMAPFVRCDGCRPENKCPVHLLPQSVARERYTRVRPAFIAGGLVRRSSS